MKMYRFLLACSVLTLASQASAARYAFCAQYDAQYNLVVSGIVEIGDSPDDFTALEHGFMFEFRDYLLSTGSRASPGGCNAKQSVAQVKEQWERDSYQLSKEGQKVIQTGWTGDRPAAVDRADTSRLSSSGVAALNRVKDDAFALEAQRSAAEVNAKRVADAARNTEEMKLKIAKFKEDLKKRGRAQ